MVETRHNNGFSGVAGSGMERATRGLERLLKDWKSLELSLKRKEEGRDMPWPSSATKPRNGSGNFARDEREGGDKGQDSGGDNYERRDLTSRRGKWIGAQKSGMRRR